MSELDKVQISSGEELAEVLGHEESDFDREDLWEHKLEQMERRVQRMQRRDEALICFESGWASQEFWGLDWEKSVLGTIEAETDDGVLIKSDKLAPNYPDRQESEWGPKSQVTLVIEAEPEENKLVVEQEGDEIEGHQGTSDEADIVIKREIRTKYGPKAVLEGDTYDAKEDIKELDFDETHRTFDDGEGAWLVDKDSIKTTVEHLAENGWTVAVGEKFLSQV